MITVTPAALEQMVKAAASADADGMGIRLAATVQEDGSYHYGMGFDTAGEDDAELKLKGVTIIVGPSHINELKGMTVDFVEIAEGEYNFIFMNPNDPAYIPPAE